MSLSANFPSVPPSLNLDFAGSERLDPRITFTRATTARYYDGVTTAKAEENLLIRSQELESGTWFKNAITTTANTTSAPDGTTTAETITTTATTNSHFTNQSLTFSSLTYVFSFFAKAGTHNYVQLFAGAQATHANFDITAGAGVTGTSNGIVSSSITSVGNDWYRCVVVFTSTSANSVGVALTSDASAARLESWTALGTETVFLWGAQVEQRSAVTAYTPTTTQPITNYIPVLLTAAAGVARFDHTPTTGTSLGLLVEEQRTNLFLQSEDFNTSWGKSNSPTVVTDTHISPAGTLTADTIGSAAANSFISQTITLTGDGTKAYSFYIKANTSARSSFTLRDSTAGVSRGAATITWTAGVPSATVSNGSLLAMQAVGNGWYRIQVAVDGVIAANTNQMRLLPDDLNGTGSIVIWGAQAENAAFPTSYIPTVASTVTRNADAASMTGTNFSSWYSQGQGSVVVDSVRIKTNAFPNRISFFDGTANNRILLFVDSAFNSSTYRIDTSGVTQVNIFGSGGGLNSLVRTAAAWETNNASVVYNGSVQGTNTSCTIPVVDQLAIGSNNWTGYFQRIAFYPTRLTNEQLVALTR